MHPWSFSSLSLSLGPAMHFKQFLELCLAKQIWSRYACYGLVLHVFSSSACLSRLSGHSFIQPAAYNAQYSCNPGSVLQQVWAIHWICWDIISQPEKRMLQLWLPGAHCLVSACFSSFSLMASVEWMSVFLPISFTWTHNVLIHHTSSTWFGAHSTSLPLTINETSLLLEQYF